MWHKLTDNYPFFVQGRGFIQAERLLVGDKLVGVNGDDLFIEKYHIEIGKKYGTYDIKPQDIYLTREGVTSLLYKKGGS